MGKQEPLLEIMTGASEFDLRKEQQRIFQEMRKRNDALKAQSKHLEQLVVSFEGRVVSPPIQETYAHTITPHSEMMIGGITPEYSAGQSTTTTFKMNIKTANRTINPVHIAFGGPLALELDDDVRIYLLLGKSKEYEESESVVPLSSGDLTVHLVGAGEKAIPSVWVPRELEKNERALVIVKYLKNRPTYFENRPTAIYIAAGHENVLGNNMRKILEADFPEIANY